MAEKLSKTRSDIPKKILQSLKFETQQMILDDSKLMAILKNGDKDRLDMVKRWFEFVKMSFNEKMKACSA